MLIKSLEAISKLKLLASINPEKVTRASPRGKRFVDELHKKMEA